MSYSETQGAPRVLFYEDPVTDRHDFTWRTPHILLDCPLMRGLSAKGWPCRMLLNRCFAGLALQRGIANAALVEIEETDWIALLDHPQENINTLFYRGRGAEQCARRAEAVASALGDFRPDIIITWTPAPFLRMLFPRALILHRESGIFTRAPYPLTYFLDPCGFLGQSWPAQFDAVSHDPSAVAQIAFLRSHFREQLQDTQKIPALLGELARFRKTILLASQISGHFSFDGVCAYRSQTHMVADVLEHTPPNVAVLLGQHPNARQLSHGELAWLHDRFPNFVHDPTLAGVEGISQQLLMCSDAVATVSSTVGWQGIFWGKPLIALGSSHLTRPAQGSTAAAIAAVMKSQPPESSARTAAWLVFHYCIPAAYLDNPDWLAPYLRDRLEHWQQHGASGYYDLPYAPPLTTARDLMTLAPRQRPHDEPASEPRQHQKQLQSDNKLSFIASTIARILKRKPQTTESSTRQELAPRIATFRHSLPLTTSMPGSLNRLISEISERAENTGEQPPGTRSPHQRPLAIPMHHVLDRLIEKIKAAPIDPEPSDNIYMEDVFSPDIYAQILALLPDDQAYDYIEHPDAVLPDGTKTRKLLDLTDATLERLQPESRAFWRNITGVLTSPTLVHAITKKFSARINSIYGQNWPELVPVPLFYRDLPGYRISIHPDAPFKIATLQFYFARDMSQIHLGTSFHVKDGNKFREHKTNLFKPNSAYAFVRTDCSWHSVKQMATHETKRDTLALTIYQKGTEYKSPYGVLN